TFAYGTNPAGGTLDRLSDTAVYAAPTPGGAPAAHVAQQYDGHGRVTGRTAYQGGGSGPADVLDGYAYAFLPGTGLLAREDRDGPGTLDHATTYAYDAVGQVLSVTRDG